MKKLWAPWRIGYINKAVAHKKERCIFCSKTLSRKNDLVVAQTPLSRVMLNLYPYNNGHLLVAPLRHVADLAELTDRELLDLFKTVNKAKQLLSRTLKPSGFNIGINLSRTAGAGITGHLHVHIVPRWEGDTNFMPVLFGTKVISQSLKELHAILKKNLSAKDKV